MTNNKPHSNPTISTSLLNTKIVNTTPKTQTTLMISGSLIDRLRFVSNAKNPSISSTENTIAEYVVIYFAQSALSREKFNLLECLKELVRAREEKRISKFVNTAREP